ncbi:MAG: hypothetical protein HY710_13875 [Candidatus Latescibacteria bacterium]|nr:hypothetical protein [Candidatus Latescibacterota bacterium]
MSTRKKIAAVITSYFPRSHADVIVTKYLKGFPTDDGIRPPRADVVSIFLDQIHPQDIGLGLAREHNVPVYQSIREALTLGGRDLAVDGVLLIGEHGDYPHNEKGQHLYPRKYLFEQICGTFAFSGRPVPVFNDKHLSYNWTDSKWMVDRAVELRVPFMAGSSLPVCWRDPFLEHPLETPIQEAVAVAYGGLESYGFHALETLQCMIERRRGGETGVAAVQCLEGEAVWRAGDEGRWSRALVDAALRTIPTKPEGRMEAHCKEPAVMLIEYRDDCRGAVLMLNGYLQDFAYAARSDGEVLATEFYLQNEWPYGHFSYLSLNIEEMFVTGRPQYPAERTLLTSGILDGVMNSCYQGHVRLETPHLDVQYRSYEHPLIRPTGSRPAGALLEKWP